MEFFEVVHQRRSIRRFAPSLVREEDLQLMLQIAGLAPSPANAQPWKFIVVRDAELREKLKDVVEAQLSAQVEAAGERQKRRLQRLRFYTTFFAQAPVVIAVATYPVPREPPEYNPGLQSVGAAIAYLLLAATALGYGSCWATLPLDFARQELEALLEVKLPWFLVALVAVGVPDEVPPPRPRKPLEKITSFK